MSLLTNVILNEISNFQRVKLTVMGFSVEDEFEIGNYQVILLYHPLWHGGTYVIGFQYKGTDFTDETVQHEEIQTDVNLRDLAQIPPRVRQWVNQFGEIIIGSHNLNKLKVYKRIFQRYNYTIKELSRNEFTIS